MQDITDELHLIPPTFVLLSLHILNSAYIINFTMYNCEIIDCHSMQSIIIYFTHIFTLFDVIHFFLKFRVFIWDYFPLAPFILKFCW